MHETANGHACNGQGFWGRRRTLSDGACTAVPHMTPLERLRVAAAHPLGPREGRHRAGPRVGQRVREGVGSRSGRRPRMDEVWDPILLVLIARIHASTG